MRQEFRDLCMQVSGCRRGAMLPLRISNFQTDANAAETMMPLWAAAWCQIAACRHLPVYCPAACCTRAHANAAGSCRLLLSGRRMIFDAVSARLSHAHTHGDHDGPQFPSLEDFWIYWRKNLHRVRCCRCLLHAECLERVSSCCFASCESAGFSAR
jgi:hypothetical protein